MIAICFEAAFQVVHQFRTRHRFWLRYEDGAPKSLHVLRRINRKCSIRTLRHDGIVKQPSVNRRACWICRGDNVFLYTANCLYFFDDLLNRKIRIRQYENICERLLRWQSRSCRGGFGGVKSELLPIMPFHRNEHEDGNEAAE